MQSVAPHVALSKHPLPGMVVGLLYKTNPGNEAMNNSIGLMVNPSVSIFCTTLTALIGDGVIHEQTTGSCASLRATESLEYISQFRSLGMIASSLSANAVLFSKPN